MVDGEVLVAPLTNPDWMPAVRRAAALVTDSGGVTCHAAIVARELGVPAVVGTRSGTRTLHDGDEVTVDGNTGRVWSGRVQDGPRGRSAAVGAPVEGPVGPPSPETIATGLYVNLADAGTGRARSPRCRSTGWGCSARNCC